MGSRVRFQRFPAGCTHPRGSLGFVGSRFGALRAFLCRHSFCRITRACVTWRMSPRHTIKPQYDFLSAFQVLRPPQTRTPWIVFYGLIAAFKQPSRSDLVCQPHRRSAPDCSPASNADVPRPDATDGAGPGPSWDSLGNDRGSITSDVISDPKKRIGQRIYTLDNHVYTPHLCYGGTLTCIRSG